MHPLITLAALIVFLVILWWPRSAVTLYETKKKEKKMDYWDMERLVEMIADNEPSRTVRFYKLPTKIEDGPEPKLIRTASLDLADLEALGSAGYEVFVGGELLSCERVIFNLDEVTTDVYLSSGSAEEGAFYVQPGTSKIHVTQNGTFWEELSNYQDNTTSWPFIKKAMEYRDGKGR